MRHIIIKNKVICIGMHKTGTSSLGYALIELGYKVLGAREDLADDLLLGNVEKVVELADSYDALQDVPWALLYKELDEKYPNSKFILTIRDEKKWLKSAVNHFGEREIPLHKWIYGKGKVQGNESLYLQKYRNHYKGVKEYFRNREQDLLIISFDNGDGWEEICNFLGYPLPDKKFPVANKGKHNWNIKDKVYNYLRRLLPNRIRKFRISILSILGYHHSDPFNNQQQNRKYRKDLMKNIKND